jgi:hypothetical protein
VTPGFIYERIRNAPKLIDSRFFAIDGSKVTDDSTGMIASGVISGCVPRKVGGRTPMTVNGTSYGPLGTSANPGTFRLVPGKAPEAVD